MVWEWEHKRQTLSIRGRASELKRLRRWEKGGGNGASASARALGLLEARGWLGEAAEDILVVWKCEKKRILESASQETGS